MHGKFLRLQNLLHAVSYKPVSYKKTCIERFVLDFELDFGLGLELDFGLDFESGRWTGSNRERLHRRIWTR